MFCVSLRCYLFFLFFFNDPATTQLYTLSLHDALPISRRRTSSCWNARWASGRACSQPSATAATTTGCSTATRGIWKDRKSTRLNSSHSQISYAVFCLKKKKKKTRKIYDSGPNKSPDEL